MLASLSFFGIGWWWLVLAAAVVLTPLAWLAVAPARRAHDARGTAVALALRTLGIGLLLITVLDPQWTSSRAVPGENQVAVLVDNSQGLVMRDPGRATTRSEELLDHLSRAETGWLADLANTFQVRTYRFDRDLHRVRDFAGLDFTGDRTALGATLARMRERFAGQPLAAILLFTDGNATDITDPASLDLRGLPPVHPVVLGRGAVSDIRIERVAVRQTAFDDTPVTVEVDVAADGLGRPQPVTVSLHPLDAGAASAEASRDPAPADLELGGDGRPASVAFAWRPRGAGVQFHEVSVVPPEGAVVSEATTANNRRVILIDRGRPEFRILYVGGRPGWEFKLLNRAIAEDPQLRMVGLLRAARREPKFEFKGRSGEANNPMFRGFGADAADAPRYDQPVLVRVNTRDAEELRGGFPTTAEELFAYDAVILDDIEAAFFSQEQLSLLRRFAADRGGGLLMLGGADSLENGGYGESALSAALPVYLDRPSEGQPQGDLHWQLTREGWVQPWVRVRPEEAQERTRLGAMPPLLVAHGIRAVKPGATVLAEIEDANFVRFPALVSQRFGAGRVACLAIGDLWRWGFKGETEQADLARLWRQVARWLVTDTPQPVQIAVDQALDDGTAGVRLRVTARDRAHRPVDSATVRLTVHRIGFPNTPTSPPGAAGAFQSATLAVEPLPGAAGQFGAVFGGRDAGAYRAEVEVTSTTGELLGRAEAGWVADPAAEEFRSLAPNRALLGEIARRTGGELIELDDVAAWVARLPSQPAPVQELSSHPVWHTPWVFLAVLACFVTEWGWRRWRGLP